MVDYSMVESMFEPTFDYFTFNIFNRSRFCTFNTATTTDIQTRMDDKNWSVAKKKKAKDKECRHELIEKSVQHDNYDSFQQ